MTRWQRSALLDASCAARTARVRLDTQVAAARSAGATWEEIANLLGVTRQAAWARYHQPRRTP